MVDRKGVLKVEPSSIWGKINRYFELIFEGSVIVFGGFVIASIGIRDYYSHDNFSSWSEIIVFLSVLFVFYFLYKVHRTITILNEIIINYRDEKVQIKYSLLHIFPRYIDIRFKEFNFECSEGWSFSRSYKKIKIYKNGKKIAKLVSKQNGWKKSIVAIVIREFDIIKIENTSKNLEGNASNKLVE